MSELEFWKDLGNIFDAVMNYQKKNVEFNSRFINPWIRLGNVFERQNQATDAVQAYQRATEIDPDATQNWVDLGDAQFKNGEYAGAVEAYSKAVTLDPEAGWPLGNLALSMVTQGRIEEAIPLYEKSIDLLTEVKDKAICWNRLGNAYRKLNDYENAFHAFQKADQLDGENTGFSDKLDETPSNTSVVAPEEILEQMIVEQTLEESETESATLTVADEPAEAISQPEVEPAVMEAVQMETVDEPIALGPNTAMTIEESVTEEDAALPLNETSVEEPANEVNMAEEESPLSLHEKKFDLLQIVENVIAKVERAYAEQKSTAANEEQVVEEVSAEAELSVVSEESAQEVETVNAVSEETVQEVEPVAETNEEVEVPVMSEEIEAPTASEEAAQEVELIAETSEEVEVPVMSEKVEAPAASEEAALEVELIVEATKETALEVEAPVVSEEIEAPTASEEATKEIKAVAAELNETVETSVAVEVSAEESASEEAPRRIPAWLVIHNTVNAEEKLTVAETETQPESVATLSEISQETAISESVVNMDIVETYTDTLTVQLTTEPSLSEEPSPSEAIDQVEVHAELEAAPEVQKIIAVDESNPVVESVIAEETSTVLTDEQVSELAYEEYLRDVTAPANSLTDHVDEIQGEAPLTKVSKSGEVRIAMDTKNAHVWNELGNIYLNAGTCDDAIASYSKAIELDRHFAWPYSNLALAYVQKGRFAEAILLYQRGIELFTSDRDKAITWNRLGNVYRRINDYGNAIASYQTADELDPENATLSLRSSFGLLGNMYSDSKPAYVA